MLCGEILADWASDTKILEICFIKGLIFMKLSEGLLNFWEKFT